MQESLVIQYVQRSRVLTIVSSLKIVVAALPKISKPRSFILFSTTLLGLVSGSMYTWRERGVEPTSKGILDASWMKLSMKDFDCINRIQRKVSCACKHTQHTICISCWNNRTNKAYAKAIKTKKAECSLY